MTIYKKYIDDVNTRIANAEKIRAMLNADIERYSKERVCAQKAQDEAIRSGDVEKYNSAVEAERKAAESEVFAAKRSEALNLKGIISNDELRHTEENLLPVITKSSDATTKKLLKLCENIISVIEDFNSEYKEYNDALQSWADAVGEHFYSAPEVASYKDFIKGLYDYLTKRSTNDGETAISRGEKALEK